MRARQNLAICECCPPLCIPFLLVPFRRLSRANPPPCNAPPPPFIVALSDRTPSLTALPRTAFPPYRVL